MPELPEVETIRRGLQTSLVGQQIVRAERGPNPLRRASPLPIDALVGRTVTAIDRHAKVMFWRLDDGGSVVAHLGMTGKFLFESDGAQRRPHTHVVLALDGGQELHFIDPRRFGWFTHHGPGDPPQDAAHYGVDALDPAFTADHLGELLASSKAPLKSFMLDQTKVAGLGNIYACEALWRVGLSPRRKACNTPKTKIAPLRDAMVAVLEESLAAGGTSFNDYVDSIGQKGSFLFSVGVFQREGEPCRTCRAEIRRIVQSGRSTFYCPSCQK